jgi:hypothetical protein
MISFLYLAYFMNIYDKDIGIFYDNIINSNGTLELANYNNKQEYDILMDLFGKIKSMEKDSAFDIVEKLHSIIESEVIYNEIFNIDYKIFMEKLYAFDLNKVLGVSFFKEVIQNIQNTKIDEYGVMLYKMLILKCFKTRKDAEDYVKSFIDTTNNIKGLDRESTKNQCDNFLSLFPLKI